MFTKPESVVTRISEQVEPRTASQIVKTGYTISLPEDLVGRVVLPLYRAPRGKIQDGLRFFGPQEERISSLTHAQAIAFALGVIRTLVGAASDKALADYEQWIEQDLASLMLDGIAYSDTSDPTKQSKIASVSARVGKLDNMSEFKLKAVLALVAENLSADIVCVSFDVPSTEGPLGARSVRLSVERTDPKNISPVSEVANSWSRKWTLVRLPKLRRIFGVETTIYRHSLAYAELAGSYHLSIAGPPGTYLAKQVIQPRPGVEADASGYVLSPSTAILGPRRGQRHSHAYIRNDGTRLREAEVAATFYERPPGVIMSALLSAIAASTITLLLAVQSLLPSSNGESETDLVAILLAFPAGVALWAGFKDGSRQSLAAYGSKSVTIIGSVVAAFVYLMGQGDGSDTAPIWFLIWGLLSVNACACGVSLWVRVQTSAIVQKTAALGQKE
ncbi:hypothetical protein [Clavibacter michiganensis]|uniref:hypothetical protein n=1 Tax=Clavibacter michiganensis TaxID=28447 RepID=UPI00292F1DD1|nr:hypothetical protein [Clavibacter michiganensis]